MSEIHPPATDPTGSGRGTRRTTRIAATLAAGAALGAAAFAGVQGAVDSGSTSTATTTSPQVTTVAKTAAAYDAQAIYERSVQGVVDITVTSSQPANDNLQPFGPGGRGGAQGTGFVYDEQGNIVTAAHVVEGAGAISVKFADGTRAKATLVGSDPSSDTAVIRGGVPGSKLTPLALANSTAVEPGQGVVAIGSPFGLEESITAGIVSAVGRSIEAPNNYTISNAIQTDAAINHGNSGGPLIDSTGKVIGVNVQIATGDSTANINAGVGFAVPSNTVKAVAAALIAGKAVEHPYLGVSVGDNPSGPGAVIGTIRSGSPAATAGLKDGDVVTAIDGNPVDGSSDLTAAIASRAPGDRVTLTVKRSGSTRTIDVTLANRPATTA